MDRTSLRGELLAEFFGTLVLLALGDGVVAAVVAGGNSDFLMISFAWGLAVTMGIYVAGGLSGAHLNPAVTVALAARREIPWYKVIPYSLAQLFGAFCGAAIVLLDYGKLIDQHAQSLVVSGKFTDFIAAKNSLDGIFFTHPRVDLASGFIDQIIGTALLLFLIRAITDNRNNPSLTNLGPVAVGLVVVAIGQSFGTMAGYAINPARDLGPRLLASLCGWGMTPFVEDGGYWWVPIVAPLIGALVGIYTYDFSLRKSLIKRGDVTVAQASLSAVLLAFMCGAPTFAADVNSQPKFVVIPVYYLTDRQMTGETYGPHRRYSENCMHRMYYGTAYVSVRNADHLSASALPASLKWELTDTKPAKISRKDKITAEADDAEIDAKPWELNSTKTFLSRLEHSLIGEKPQFAVFVHGAADGFEDSLQDAAMLAYSLRKPMVLYSWPSDPHWRGYFIDGSNSEYSQEHFNIFCKEMLELRERHPFKAIIVAHSMGNRLVIRALPITTGTHIASSCELISPDIDTDTFKHYVMNSKGSSDAKIRLYVSNRDKMLPLSQLLAGGYYRLGEPAEVNHLTERQLKADHYNSYERIDFTTMDTGFAGHKLPCELVGSLVNNDQPPTGFKIVPQNSVRANGLARFANRTEKFKATASGLQSEFCKCVVRDGVK